MKKIGTKTPTILTDVKEPCFALVFDLSCVQLFGKVPTFDYFLDNNRRLVIMTREKMKR